MDYVHLGKSGMKVSKIGLGLWQASDEWKGRDESIMGAISKAYELGVNLVDTAEVYGGGRSEQVLGRALRELGRNNFVVATKVHGAHLRYDELQRAAVASMKRLGVTEIDLYQVHWPDPWEQIPLKETMRALEKLYLEGKIRAIGVSNFAVRDLEEARSCLSKTEIVSNQVRYNLVQRNIEEEVLPYAKREGITILAWSPIAQGALTGKYNSGNIPTGDVRGQNVLFAPANMVQIMKLLSTMSNIARRRQVEVSQIALNWLMSHPNVIPLPGAKDKLQVEQNVGSTRFSLTGEELSELERVCRDVKIDYLSGNFRPPP